MTTSETAVCKDCGRPVPANMKQADSVEKSLSVTGTKLMAGLRRELTEDRQLSLLSGIYQHLYRMEEAAGNLTTRKQATNG